MRLAIFCDTDSYTKLHKRQLLCTQCLSGGNSMCQACSHSGCVDHKKPYPSGTWHAEACSHKCMLTTPHSKTLSSLCATLGDSTQPTRTAFAYETELQQASRLLSEQHAIPERLLTNQQAAALLSGIPAHLRVAKAHHRESFPQLAEPGLEKEPGVQFCVLAMQPALLQCPAASYAMSLVRS